PLTLKTPEKDQHSQAKHGQAERPLFDCEEDHRESPDEDPYLSQSLPSTYVNHLPLNVPSTPRQQRRENDERYCSDEEYFRQITRIVTKRQKKAHLVPDQPRP